MTAPVDRLLDALGDPTRRRVLRRLRDEPSAVNELARHFPVSRPAISQHLRILSDAGLVSAQQVGRRRIYSCVPGGFDALRGYLDSFWSAALDNFKRRVESQRAPRRRSA